MNASKILETERLTLEKANPQDIDFFFKLLNSPNWIQFIGDRGIKSRDDADKYIRNNLMRSYQEHGYGLYKMMRKETGEPIGICGFVKRDYLEHADIGFAILPEYERQGYTCEAAKAVLEYGATVLKLDPVLAVTTPENVGSCALLQKIGLSAQGKIRLQNDGREYLLFSNQQ